MPLKSPDLIPKVMDLLLDAICVVDQEDRYTFVSGACESVFGYHADEMIGMNMYDLVHPDDLERTRAAAGKVVAGTPHLHFRNRYVRKDGSVVHIMWSARRLDENLRVGVARDITELVRAEAQQQAVYAISEAAQSARDLVALFQRVHEIVGELLPVGGFSVALREHKGDPLTLPYTTTSDGASAQLNVAMLAAAIIEENRPIASADSGWNTGEPECGGGDWMGAPLPSERGVIGALVIENRTGGEPYTEKDKALLHFVSAQIATAVERKQAELRLRHLALHDALTGLPNRELFYDRTRNALARAQRHRARVALLYIDLNDFKHVNDRHGHATGDALLQSVAQRLTCIVRDSDTVSRIGGDEFVVVLDGIGVPGDASLVAAKIREAIEQPFEIGGRRLQIASSIGVAIHPEHGLDSDTLLRYADAAMYEDKAENKVA